MRLCNPVSVFRQAGAVENAAHVVGKLHEAGDERIVPGDLAVAAGRAGRRPRRPADGLDAAQLGAEEEEIDAAGNHAQIGVVQDHAPIGVIRRGAGIGDGQVGRIAGELRRRGAAEEIVDGRRRRTRYVGAIVRNAAAPRFSARRHQDERIEDHAQAARFQVLDAAHDRLIGRRAAVDKAAADLRNCDETRRALRQARAAPFVRGTRRLLKRAVDVGRRRIDLAGGDVGRIAEPGDDQRHGRAARKLGLQVVQGDRVIGGRAGATRRIAVDRSQARLGDALTEVWNRVVGELAGRRQQIDAVDVGHIRYQRSGVSNQNTEVNSPLSF